MTRLAKLQLIGPFVLFGAVLAAESATWALSRTPSSEVLWYLNLRWFAAFQRSHYVLNDYFSMSYFQFVGIAIPLLMIAVAGWVLRRQILLAAASNLSFVYAAFLAYAWSWGGLGPKSVSLAFVNVTSGPDVYLLFVLIGGSFVSFVISHVVYLHAVRAEA